MKTISVLAYDNNSKSLKVLEVITQWAFHKEQVQLLFPKRLSSWMNFECGDFVNDVTLRNCDTMICIGGDGTFLSAARMVAPSETPILGIHTGSTGFLTDFSLNNFQDALDGIVKDDFEIKTRLMLEVGTVETSSTVAKEIVINELQIKPVEPRSMINLEVIINGHVLTNYWADSLLISTPTGSTAYNMAAGGPIIYPTADAVILNPVNPPSLTVRPIVIPADATIEIKNGLGHSSKLILDGREERFLKSNQSLKIRKSLFNTQIIRSPEYGFIEALKDKLGWNGDRYVHSGDVND